MVEGFAEDACDDEEVQPQETAAAASAHGVAAVHERLEVQQREEQDEAEVAQQPQVRDQRADQVEASEALDGREASHGELAVRALAVRDRHQQVHRRMHQQGDQQLAQHGQSQPQVPRHLLLLPHQPEDVREAAGEQQNRHAVHVESSREHFPPARLRECAAEVHEV